MEIRRELLELTLKDKQVTHTISSIEYLIQILSVLLQIKRLNKSDDRNRSVMHVALL